MSNTATNKRARSAGRTSWFSWLGFRRGDRPRKEPHFGEYQSRHKTRAKSQHKKRPRSQHPGQYQNRPQRPGVGGFGRWRRQPLKPAPTFSIGRVCSWLVVATVLVAAGWHWAELYHFINRPLTRVTVAGPLQRLTPVELSRLLQPQLGLSSQHSAADRPAHAILIVPPNYPEQHSTRTLISHPDQPLGPAAGHPAQLASTAAGHPDQLTSTAASHPDQSSPTPDSHPEQLRPASDNPSLQPGHASSATGFFSLDLQAVKAAVEAHPWVYRASVKRSWPDRLSLHITEQTAIARWRDDQLMNPFGELFKPPELAAWAKLPLLTGPDQTQFRVMQQYKILNRVLMAAGLHLTGLSVSTRGSWQLQLNDRVQVTAGREAVLARVQRFAEFHQQLPATDAALITSVDLRYASGLALARAKL